MKIVICAHFAIRYSRSGAIFHGAPRTSGTTPIRPYKSRARESEIVLSPPDICLEPPTHPLHTVVYSTSLRARTGPKMEILKDGHKWVFTVPAKQEPDHFHLRTPEDGCVSVRKTAQLLQHAGHQTHAHRGYPFFSSG